jgi:hypothetical protein
MKYRGCERGEPGSEDRINLELLGARFATLTDQVHDLKLEVADLKIPLYHARSAV